MNRLSMVENIRNQPASHAALLTLHRDSQHAVLQECAELICKAKGRVIFSGMGGSLFATMAAANRLQQHGHAVEVAESSELLHYGCHALRTGDLGLIVSRSGGSIEPVLLAQKMLHAGMKVIAVTNVPGSELQQIADVTLHIGSQPDNMVAVQTYTGTVLTLLLLAEEVSSSHGAGLSDACESSLPALATLIDECLQASEQWRDLLVDAPLYLLGRGPALGSVYEGALLVHETAKTVAVAMSCGQFRHGPAEILSRDFRAVVFGTAESTQTIDRSLADDLFAIGARVRWIGPAAAPGGNHAPSLVSWPAIDPVLAPIFEIVPLQVAAYRLALWQGITPGDFRYVTEVTSAESGFCTRPAGRQ